MTRHSPLLRSALLCTSLALSAAPAAHAAFRQVAAVRKRRVRPAKSICNGHPSRDNLRHKPV